MTVFPSALTPLFDTATAHWFGRALGQPTAVQEAAWPLIAARRHTLVSAPTGTGKTLAAFLVFIDRFKQQVRSGQLPDALQLIYVSPLKSLAGDIRENLRRPLDGITEEEVLLGPRAPDEPQEIRVAIRTGDTTQTERRSMLKRPPHILITTPESLYLLLTSKSGAGLLQTASAVIIDEMHALAGSKRGAHLLLSLARLDALCPAPLQRIGLSATVKPLETAVLWLSPDGSADSVAVAAPETPKAVEIRIVNPGDDNAVKGPEYTVWTDIAQSVVALCQDTRSVLAFTDGRAPAEKLAFLVNEIAGEGFARTHHGSVSKERRAEVEQALRDGQLRLLCATSSMELGIDVGEIDRVIQVGCPRTVSGLLQRLGRAGHNPGRVSVMHLFPRMQSEILSAGLTAHAARTGNIEPLRPPYQCLDVLAQHLVSMAVTGEHTEDEVMEMLRRASPFAGVSKEQLQSVLRMLAGDYEHSREIPVRPRLLYDRIAVTFTGDGYSRLLALSAAGTIPDRGYYAVKNEHGVKLGEVDEEFVYEARVGDKFLLGSFAWKILNIGRDDVVVAPSSTFGAAPPFWHGEGPGRCLETGRVFGSVLRGLSETREGESLREALADLGLDRDCTEEAAEYLERQLQVTGALPDDRTMIAEWFSDDAGANQVMVHSILGRRINGPLALLCQQAAKVRGVDCDVFEDDDGFLLFPKDGQEIPRGLLLSLDPETARPLLEAMLPATPLFSMTFRYNAARALMMGVRGRGRNPLWIQRLRGAELLDGLIRYPDHPLIAETRRECLEDYWDLDGLETVLRALCAGTIQVVEVTDGGAPSPMTLTLRRQTEMVFMYDYFPTSEKVKLSAAEAAASANAAGAPLLAPDGEQLRQVSAHANLPRTAQELHTLLMTEGDLAAGDLDIPEDLLLSLAGAGRAVYVEPGLWVAAEHASEYLEVFGGLDRDVEDAVPCASLEHIIRRALRYRGAMTDQAVSQRYALAEREALEVLTALCDRGETVEADGVYYHARLYERARRETLKARRQVKTRPPQFYAALLIHRASISGTPERQLAAGMEQLAGMGFPAHMWEDALLPARVRGYRPDMLDRLLAEGEYVYVMDGSNVRFIQGDNDGMAGNRQVDPAPTPNLLLAEAERLVLDTLAQRGASFTRNFPLPPGVSPQEALLSLTAKGLIHADSFVPVRQILHREQIQKASRRQRVGARVMTLTAGRWELSRPIPEATPEEQIHALFLQYIIACRETAKVCGMDWLALLDVLRLWEYQGRARRGYFIEGLSGAQFVAPEDHDLFVYAADKPEPEVIWLNAADPAQPWGGVLRHAPGRSFLRVPGTAVGLSAGEPIAILERQGQTLRVFEPGALAETLKAFVTAYKGKRIFPALRRVRVSEYPPEAEDALREAGFTREMLDWCLYG